jgi:tetratricopeptide (TPR) repeat protein
MPDDPNRPIQPAVGQPAGLVKEDRRPSTMGGLTFEKLVDAAESARPALVAIADQVLQAADPLEPQLGDYGLAQLVAEQAIGRARELLERANSLISGGKCRMALIPIEEALAADSSSGEAWALKGRCLAELGLHEAALRVFHYARERVSDPQLRILILKLEADSAHSVTRTTETKVVQLAGNGQIDEAMALVRDALGRQPSNIVFLYHLADLHWRSGNIDAARAAIQEAHRHVGRDSVDLLADLERKIEFGPHLAAVEEARRALRQRDPATALSILDSCAAALERNEHYQGLRAYAESKRKVFGQLLGAKSAVVPVSVQQQTIRWVLFEELREADQAMRASDYARARAALDAAGRLEPDCGAVLYRHASAIVAANRAGRPAVEELKKAETLAARCAVDPAYEELAAALVGRIQEMRAAG